MQKISAYIPMLNEAGKSKAAVESVLWADEVVVVEPTAPTTTPRSPSVSAQAAAPERRREIFARGRHAEGSFSGYMKARRRDSESDLSPVGLARGSADL